MQDVHTGEEPCCCVCEWEGCCAVGGSVVAGGIVRDGGAGCVEEICDVGAARADFDGRCWAPGAVACVADVFGGRPWLGLVVVEK